MTEFEELIGEELALYADGDGDMAHDVLYRIQAEYIFRFGALPEVPND